jgi:hypothetical protein
MGLSAVSHQKIQLEYPTEKRTCPLFKFIKPNGIFQASLQKIGYYFFSGFPFLFTLFEL